MMHGQLPRFCYPINCRKKIEYMKNDIPVKRRRPPVKRDSVVRQMRELIVSGKLAPGAQMPTHKEFEFQLDAESQTICDALRVLREDGFIETQHRRGTFVVPNPPHLTEFALAFPFPLVTGLSRFYEALRDEAAKHQSAERKISAYYGVADHVDVKDYQRLLGRVQAHRLAGLIFAGNPYALEATESLLVREKGLSRVAIMMPVGTLAYPTVYPDINSFLPKAFDYLASCGRKRVAVVLLGGAERPFFKSLQPLAGERGLILQPHWLQGAFAGSSEWTRQLALLMMHGAPGERPDSVVITDDNLVESFTEGIRDSGVPVVDCDKPGGGGDLAVVAQANFPYPTRSVVPAKRLGYSIPRLMSVCLELLEQQRRGEAVPAHTVIPVEFEHE